MNDILHLLQAAGYFVLIPLLLGIVIKKYIVRNDWDMAWIYSTGYVVYFALFWLVSLWPHVNAIDFSFDEYIRMWEKIIPIVGVALLILANVSLVTEIRDMFGRLFQNKWRLLLVTAMCVMTVVSILCTVPSPYDNTPENASIIDGISNYYYPGYVEDIYTYPECFYVLFSRMTGVATLVTIHTVCPAALLFFFFCAYLTAGEILFSDDDRMQNIFMAFVMVTYFIISFTDSEIGMQVMLNVWNGKTMAINVLLPLEFAYGVKMVGSRGKALAGTMALMGINLMAIQLHIVEGAKTGAIMMGVFVVAWMFELIYAKRRGGKISDGENSQKQEV